MTHLVALALCLAGFACLCAAMTRHQRDLVGRILSARARHRLRSAGGATLLLALVIDMAGLGAGYGAIAWFGHLTLGAALVLARVHRVSARPARRP